MYKFCVNFAPEPLNDVSFWKLKAEWSFCIETGRCSSTWKLGIIQALHINQARVFAVLTARMDRESLCVPRLEARSLLWSSWPPQVPLKSPPYSLRSGVGVALPQVNIIGEGSGKAGTTHTKLRDRTRNKVFRVECLRPVLCLPTELGRLPWLLPFLHPSPTLEGSLPL